MTVGNGSRTSPEKLKPDMESSHQHWRQDSLAEVTYQKLHLQRGLSKPLQQQSRRRTELRGLPAVWLSATNIVSRFDWRNCGQAM